MRLNSSSWRLQFQGKLHDVNPNEIVHTGLVREGESINFGGRYLSSSNRWSTFYSSQNSSKNVIALVDGDSVTVKRYRRAASTIYLEPANTTLSPLVLAEERVRIQGVVIGVLRRY